jgi:hypothetical protein
MPMMSCFGHFDVHNHKKEETPKSKSDYHLTLLYLCLTGFFPPLAENR